MEANAILRLRIHGKSFMPNVSDIQAVHVTLKIGDEQALFILLAADGSINRLGTGSVNNKDKDLFIGITKDSLFDQLMSNLDDEMLNYMGGYDVPEKHGKPCELMIGLSFASDDDNGFAFRYGSESEGPPGEIVQFVTSAVQLTDPWFREQKKMVQGAKSDDNKKPWWKFW